jgi:hypothetical protein
MTAIRFFTDEDIYSAVAPALRQRGIDTVSTPELVRLGETDEAQLEWAASEGRVIVTFNVAHFATLHDQYMVGARHHAGIVVSAQISIGELLRRIMRLSESLDAEVMQDRLEFLGDWSG